MRTLLIGGTTIAPIPARFSQIPLLAQLQILTVFHLGDFVMVLLGLFGFFIFLRKSRKKEFSNDTQAIYLLLTILLGIVILFLSFQFASRFGTLHYSRFIDYAIPLCVPLAGLTLWQLNGFLEHISSKVIRNIAFALVLLVLFFSCLIQFFSYQQLIPRADVLSSDLPNNEFIDCIGRVNTQYQKEMISFAERYSSDGRIASDVVTRYQLHGFSNYSFVLRHIWYSPLYFEAGWHTDKNLQWNLCLLHTSKAAFFQEKVEYRTRERIQDLRLKAGNVIYDNGESFIMSYSPRTIIP